MTHFRWEVRALLPDGEEWVKTYPTRKRAHVAYHNRIRLSPIGTEVYMYDLEDSFMVKMKKVES